MSVTKWKLSEVLINVIMSVEMEKMFFFGDWLSDSNMNSVSATNSLMRFCKLWCVFALVKQKKKHKKNPCTFSCL